MQATDEKVYSNYYLMCSGCDKVYPHDVLNTYAGCVKCGRNPLVTQLDFPAALNKASIDVANNSMWRYHSMLPVNAATQIVTLGEGWTPVLELKSLARVCGVDELLMKDESLNPTGSFKARGLSMAVTKAKELGVERCIIPTAGNAGGAMSAYCASAGMKATVVLPAHTPKIFKNECEWFGAEVILVDGLISDCAKRVAELNRDGEFFDMSTFKEPYRLEGKKTMGYEIAEQLQWQLPDVIFYPTGGGTGLVGIWKAFHEMIALGWISEKLPRMVVVQSENCKPIVETWWDRQQNSKTYRGRPTLASGLAVPNPFAERMILDVVRASQGTAVAVSDEAIIHDAKEIASCEGLLVAPEGATLYSALKKLLDSKFIDRSERILFLNTGSGYKYMEGMESSVV